MSDSIRAESTQTSDQVRTPAAFESRLVCASDTAVVEPRVAITSASGIADRRTSRATSVIRVMAGKLGAVTRVVLNGWNLGKKAAEFARLDADFLAKKPAHVSVVGKSGAVRNTREGPSRARNQPRRVPYAQ